MSRYILDESKIHPSIHSTISDSYRSFVEEIINVVENNEIVVIGMAVNPVCKKARRILTEQNLSFTYLEYGSYLKEWRKRNALKMWTGWKTFPMVFINGIFIGGASELEKLVETNALETVL